MPTDILIVLGGTCSGACDEESRSSGGDLDLDADGVYSQGVLFPRVQPAGSAPRGGALRPGEKHHQTCGGSWTAAVSSWSTSPKEQLKENVLHVETAELCVNPTETKQPRRAREES